MVSTTIKIDTKVKEILFKLKEDFGAKTISDTIQILALKYENLLESSKKVLKELF